MAEKATTSTPPASKEGGFNAIPQELLSLAMAFVPSQHWQNIYETNVAHARGTIFADLDKPFIGEEAVCHDRT
ncbi:MAG: spore coat associated protein CotJA [Eubacteriales bacterium]|nr:spore coat associated protein CotJA [Eubacteriales bacterium]